MISLKFIIAGVGPGDPDLVTLGALRSLAAADLVLIPHSQTERASVAEQAVRAHLKDLKTTPILFPMTMDGESRDQSLKAQLEALRPQWETSSLIVLPVIGDSTLYATGFYLYELWRGMEPRLELGLIPGISAHSLAASRSGTFLAMGQEILTVVPGTAGTERVAAALAAADSAAVYKPSALKERLRQVVGAAGPWKKIIRIDRAGLADEKILEGADALAPASEYLSILLLRR